MAPSFEFRLADDVEAADFIRTTFSGETWEHYRSLQIGAAKADFWRLLTIYRHGGVYMDMDATLIWPLAFILGSDKEVFLRHGKNFTNYFFAASPENEHVAMLIEAVNRNIAEGTIRSVFDLTGPTVLVRTFEGVTVNAESYNTVCREGVITNEFFQYRDRPTEKWGKKQAAVPIIKPN